MIATLVAATLAAQAAPATAVDHGKMDHSKMDHGKMQAAPKADGKMGCCKDGCACCAKDKAPQAK
jgi:hypothetical protein